VLEVEEIDTCIDLLSKNTLSFTKYFFSKNAELFTSWYDDLWKFKDSNVLTHSRFNLKHSGILVDGDSLMLQFLNQNTTPAYTEEKTENGLVDDAFGTLSLHVCFW
jgi:hypothetical protein